MRIFGKHVFRSIRSSPLQPIMIVAVVMLSVAVMIVSVALPINIYRNERASLNVDEWTPDLTVSLKSTSDVRLIFEDEVRDAVGDRGRVIGDFALGGYYDIVNDGGEEDSVRVALLAIDLVEADSFYELRYTDYGKFTDKNLKTSAIIRESFAKERELSVGDDFTINILGHSFTYTVQAIAKDTGLLLDKECFVDISSVRLALAERSPLIASLSDEFKPYTRICIKLNDKSDTNAVKAELESLESFADKKVSVNNDETSGDFISTILTLTIVIPAILLVIVSSMLMVSSFELLQKKRLSDIALFKIVGADSVHINMMLYLESAVYGTVGGVLGCLLAFPATLWLNKLYGFRRVRMSFGIFEILIGMGSALAFTLLCTAMHIRKHKKKTLQAELSGGNFDRDKRFSPKKLLYGIPAVTLLALIFILPPRQRYIPAFSFVCASIVFLYVLSPYVIAALASLISRALLKCKRGTGDFIIASKACENSYPLKHAGRMMTVLVTVFISMITVLSAVNEQLESYLNFATFDYTAMYSDDITKEKVIELEGVESVAEAMIKRDVVFANGVNTTGIAITGDRDSCFSEFILPDKMPEGDQIALSKGVAEMLGLKVGDSITCKISDIQCTLTLYEIVSTHGDFAFYDSKYVGTNTDMLCITTDGTPEAHEALLSLLDERGVLCEEREKFFSSTYKRINPQLTVFNAMMYIMIFMTVVGIINILSEQRMVRQPEFEVLKQNGKTKKGLISLQVVEVAYLLICAVVIALIASAVVCFALDKAAVSFGMTLYA